tara:strand:- start:321 stop:536 length:216 start_codon:yes stop_codon:yes gene_type:complete
MVKNILIILFIFFLLENKAFAYLDPGSGSIIIQAIIAFFAAAFATFSFYWTKFKQLLTKIFKNKKHTQNKN